MHPRARLQEVADEAVARGQLHARSTRAELRRRACACRARDERSSAGVTRRRVRSSTDVLGRRGVVRELDELLARRASSPRAERASATARTVGLGPIDRSYDDLTAAEVGGARRSPGTAAQARDARAERDTLDRSRRRCRRARPPSAQLTILDGVSPATARVATSTAPARARRRARADRRHARPRRQRRRAPRRLRRLRRRRAARRPRARRRRQVQARLRRGARRRDPRAVARPDRAASPTIPGAPWQVLSYERQLEVKAEQVGDALRRIGRLEGFEQDPIVPAVEQWRYRNKLEYSFGTGAGRRRSCAASTRPAASTRSSPLDDCLLASERGNAAREQVLAWCREQGLKAWDRRDAERPAAQPRRPRGQAHRRAAGAARHLAGRDRRRRPRRGGRLRGPVLDAGRRRSARARRAARRSGSSGSKRLREQLGELEFLISPEAFFQTNTEMAEVLYGAAVELADAARARAGLRPLLRDRHDRARRSPSRAREVIGVEIVEPAVADAIDNARRNEITNASLLRRRHPAGDARARRAGGQARRLRDRPAPRGPLAEGRAADHRGRRRSGSSTCRATRRRWRRTRPSWSRPATRCAACARSTCSRRRRTSSAWRCSSAPELRRASRPVLVVGDEAARARARSRGRRRR